MKTLSLLQPWASLLALGAKRVETRTWGTDYRGLLAVHASAGLSKDVKEMCAFEPWPSVLALIDAADVGELPRGEIVGQVKLVDCVQVDAAGGIGNWSWMLEGLEPSFGNFAPGRWAWICLEPQLAEPGLKAKGSLGLWNWNPPAYANWRRAPWLVTCANPNCVAPGRTTVGVRARLWRDGICLECRAALESVAREAPGLPYRGSPTGILALPPSSAEPVRRRGKARESGEGFRS